MSTGAFPRAYMSTGNATRDDGDAVAVAHANHAGGIDLNNSHSQGRWRLHEFHLANRSEKSELCSTHFNPDGNTAWRPHRGAVGKTAATGSAVTPGMMPFLTQQSDTAAAGNTHQTTHMIAPAHTANCMNDSITHQRARTSTEQRSLTARAIGNVPPLPTAIPQTTQEPWRSHHCQLAPATATSQATTLETR
jgi:hypothetical protein